MVAPYSITRISSIFALSGYPSPTTTRGAGGYSLEEITNNDLTAPIEYRVAGYSQMTKTARASGTTARIYVPKSWAGCRVAVILLDPPDDPILN